MELINKRLEKAVLSIFAGFYIEKIFKFRGWLESLFTGSSIRFTYFGREERS